MVALDDWCMFGIYTIHIYFTSNTGDLLSCIDVCSCEWYRQKENMGTGNWLMMQDEKLLLSNNDLYQQR